MGLEQFQTDNQATWERLDTLVAQAGSRPASMPGRNVRELGTLYRRTAADLAQARHRFPNAPVVARLENLVRQSRPLVYARSGEERITFKEFFATEYWRVLMERPRLLVMGAMLLLGPAVIGVVLAFSDPATTTSILPPGFLWVTEPQATGTDLGADTAALTAFSFAVLVNNIQVTVLAFALGITLGLGTALVTAFNGFILGGVMGLGVAAGNSALLVEAIAAHGILELSCIVVAAAAGLRMASGLVTPGTRPRRVALRDEALAAVKIVIGTAPWLVFAGFVEGFVSRTGTNAAAAVVIGVVVGATYWGLAAVRGIRAGSPDA